MGVLADQIREAVRDERFVFGAHADQRMRERGILGWQIIAGVASAKLLLERPQSTPNPVIELEQLLSDGTSFKAVWAWIPSANIAKLVTVHFLDG